jgi:hypothetical protein
LAGIFVFVAGLFLLGQDVHAWLGRGVQSSLALTCVAEFVDPWFGARIPPDWGRAVPGVVELCRAVPVSLLLMVLGWTIYQLAVAGWEARQAGWWTADPSSAE